MVHELQELEHNVVVVQEVSASILFDGAPDPVDHLKHPHDLVFDLAFFVRLFPRHGEEDIVEVLHVFGELALPYRFLHIDGGYFAKQWEFIFNLVQNFERNLLAFPSLELSEDLLEVVQLVVRPFWSCDIVVEVGDDELRFVIKYSAIFTHFVF